MEDPANLKIIPKESSAWLGYFFMFCRLGGIRYLYSVSSSVRVSNFDCTRGGFLFRDVRLLFPFIGGLFRELVLIAFSTFCRNLLPSSIRDDELSIVGMGAMDFWAQESNGTRKFIELAVPIVNALDNGYTLYLDEYGTYLHPNLAKALLLLFKSDQNKTWARLILNTQGTPLMGEVAERDEIVFVEKNMAEESRVTALKDRSARTNEPFEKRYLRGIYGAVPLVLER